MAKPRQAPGGGRTVEVPPDRLAGWFDRFSARHDGVVTTEVGELVVRAVANDGATATATVPFGPLEAPPGTFDGLVVDAIVAHALVPRRVALVLVRLGGHSVGIARRRPGRAVPHRPAPRAGPLRRGRLVAAAVRPASRGPGPARARGRGQRRLRSPGAPTVRSGRRRARRRPASPRRAAGGPPAGPAVRPRGAARAGRRRAQPGRARAKRPCARCRCRSPCATGETAHVRKNSSTPARTLGSVDIQLE